MLGWDPWPKQREILNDLVARKRVTVVSCNGAGKTALAARAILWFQNTRQNAITITTAPSATQVFNVMWRQLRSAYQVSKKDLTGEMLKKRYEHGPTWYAQGIATDKEEQFQGFHAQDGGEILVVIDEASGVKSFVSDAIQGYLTQPESYVLLIGNGNKADGFFHKTHQPFAAGQWAQHHISALEVPEVWPPGSNNTIMSKDWIEECRIWWGEDSPQWAVRVLGQFPAAGADWQLIPQWLLVAAQDEFMPDKDDGVHMGVDVARGNIDNNVAVCTRSGRVSEYEFWQSSDAMVTAMRICRLAEQWRIPEGHVHIEVDGLGGPIIDRCREAGLSVDAVNTGGGPVGEWSHIMGPDTRFKHRKAELAFTARQRLLDRSLCIPQDATPFWSDVQRINYDVDDKGYMILEPKRKLRKRDGNKSPDFADAIFISQSRTGATELVYFV